ncbi:activator-dependent family glycosyltransferase [Streptomyces sp. NPDC057245]|uniref:activator-dependent family glycosyltransferase n=1 Tax=Streptomyces TaxID=1883 RepID=UPI001C1E048F|nr:activator-dependent family glycosyltransferase [Streptomyces sp. A108]MBU6533277.1 activator-dependent family glycosyltransferase [Streptomyces sp. A108]
MKILFVSMPHPTHFHPMLPLAWALRAAGHEVRVAGPPDLTETATGSGMTAVPVGKPGWYRDDTYEPELYARLMGNGASDFLGTFDWAASDARSWSWEGLLGLEKVLVSALYAGINNDPLLDELVAYARHWQPDLVVWEQLTVAGAVAAELLGVPHARFVYGLDFIGRAREAFLRRHDEQPAEHREDPTREWLEETVRRFGGTWTERLRTGGFTIDTSLPSTRLDTTGPVESLRYIPYNGPSVVPDWLREPAGRRRVCLTLGLSNEIENTSTTVADIVAGLADLDVEVVATLHADDAAGLGRLPDNVRLVDFVPLHDLLPTCAAVVHHGGIGSRLTAVHHAVPQLVLGHGYDTMMIARRQEELEAGLALPADSATADAVRDHVTRLLDEPRFAAGAAGMRDELLAQPSPADLVASLEHLVGERAGAVR